MDTADAALTTVRQLAKEFDASISQSKAEKR
jgi:hypothetical protein